MKRFNSIYAIFYTYENPKFLFDFPSFSFPAILFFFFIMNAMVYLYMTNSFRSILWVKFFSHQQTKKKIDVRICIINIRTKPYLYYHCSTEGKMFFFFEKKNYNIYLSTDHNEVILQFNQLFSIEAIRFFLIEIVFWKIIQCWKKNIYFHHHQSLIHEFCSINAAKFSQEGENYNRAIYQLKSISERYLCITFFHKKKLKNNNKLRAQNLLILRSIMYPHSENWLDSIFFNSFS